MEFLKCGVYSWTWNLELEFVVILVDLLKGGLESKCEVEKDNKIEGEEIIFTNRLHIPNLIFFHLWISHPNSNPHFYSHYKQ